MFRFTIRDVLWLTVVVALAVGWWLNNSRLHARFQTLEARATLSEVEFREIFPPGWEGLTAAMRNERSLLKFQVSALEYELVKRGHRVVIDQDYVVVDLPAATANRP